MREDRRAHIEATIARLEAQSQHWTNQTIYAEVRGSYRELNTYLRDRRAAERGDTVAVLEAPEPEPAPPPAVVPLVPIPAALPGALGAMRRRYHELAQEAYGTPPGSFERHELARCQAAFAQQVQSARQCLDRARRLRPIVAYERTHAARTATGRPDAADFLGQLAHGTTPQAQMLRAAMAVLTQWVGQAEATRLVGTSEEPQWALHTG